MPYKRPHTGIVSFAILISVLVSSCGTLPSGGKWGEDATLFPGASRINLAAKNAATNPATWVPLIGSALFSIEDFDRQVSDNARENTPLFGSEDAAGDGSDLLRDSLVASVVITSIATPSGDNNEEWIMNKTRGLLVDYAALRSTSLVTSVIKKTTGRERPNARDEKSFPSGHTSRAFAAATLSSRNLDSLTLTDTQKTGMRIGLYSFAVGTAWARIEAGMHYPSDVLAGAALGNFMASFIHDAFLGLDDQSMTINVDAYPDYKMLTINWHF